MPLVGNDVIQLEPYIFQVGGHSSLLCIDEVTVCKPFVQREVNFYRTLPEQLKDFAPEFRGVVEVNFVNDGDGYVTVTTPAIKNGEEGGRRGSLSPGSLSRELRRIRIRAGNDVEIEGKDQGEVFEELSGSQHVKARQRLDPRTEIPLPLLAHNPWILKCHRDTFKKMAILSTHYSTQKYILLENLTGAYKYPCVLDLKMGKRQYGDDATPAKKQRQNEKVANTTSDQLGVRICGMQVYQKTSGRFLCYNKYYGRDLDVGGFHQALCQFFHDGNDLRTGALEDVVRRIRCLKKILETQDSYRFYTSSLLIIYDGDEEEKEVEMQREQNDGGWKKCLKEKNGDPSPPNGVTSHEKLQLPPPSPEPSTNQWNNQKNHRDQKKFTNGECGKDDDASDDHIDVRMIDFAHSTHKDLGDVKVHAGPDAGYLFGLRSLLDALESVMLKLKTPGN